MLHVPTLGHVKEPNTCSKLRGAGKIRMFSFIPSLVSGLSRRLVRSASGDEGRYYFRGKSTISLQAAVLNRPRRATFTFTF
jgi:hypothetical protein